MLHIAKQGEHAMQQMWTEIDNYIDAHLIPEDPILLQTLENTEKHGFPDHLAVAPNQGMLLQMLIQMNQCKRGYLSLALLPPIAPCG